MSEANPLFERVRNLSERLDGVEAYQKAQQRFKELEELQKKLTENKRIDSFRQSVRSLETFHEEGCIKSDSLPDIRDERERAEEIIAKLKENTDKPAEVKKNNSFHTFVQSVDRVSQSCDNLADRIWKEYKEKHDPDVSEVMLEIQQQLGVDREQVRKIIEMREAFVQVSHTLPRTKKDLDRWLRLSERISEAIQGLEMIDAPENVQRFLQRTITARGATLIDLPPEVFTWLQEKGWLVYFTVKPSRR
jgi:hypothetical protein